MSEELNLFEEQTQEKANESKPSKKEQAQAKAKAKAEAEQEAKQALSEAKKEAVAEAEARREQWVQEREQAKNKYDSLIVQAKQFIEYAQEHGDTEEVKQLAYEFMYRRYLSGEFEPIK